MIFTFRNANRSGRHPRIQDLIRVPVWALLALLVTQTLLSPRAKADTSGEVLVILGREKPGAVDAELKKITALNNPPFKSFQSMSTLSKISVSLTPGKDTLTDLPNGQQLRLTLIEKQSATRFKIKVSINQADKKKEFLPLLEVSTALGEYFFVAGQKYKDGTLIIGVRVTKA